MRDLRAGLVNGLGEGFEWLGMDFGLPEKTCQKDF